MEIAQPTLLEPDSAILEVAMDISPSCNLKLDERKLSHVASLYAQTLQGYELIIDNAPHSGTVHNHHILCVDTNVLESYWSRLQ